MGPRLAYDEVDLVCSARLNHAETHIFKTNTDDWWQQITTQTRTASVISDDTEEYPAHKFNTEKLTLH